MSFSNSLPVTRAKLLAAAELKARGVPLPPEVLSCLTSRTQTPAQAATWPSEFVNAETGRVYAPHHVGEREFVEADGPRYGLAKGGEGGGKSVAGIVKNLNRLRRGCSGIMVSPDFEHFKKSLWPEFRRWCPPAALFEKDRYRLAAEWEATRPFELHFRAENDAVATLYCGGIEDPSGWEGPNVNFAHLDEARRHRTPAALKVLDGRVRIPGPGGVAPQLYLTTTPAKHWLYEYFGPLLNDDPRAAFKADARVVTLLTADNERAGNLEQGFTQKRRQSLTESEARVLLEAEWEDIDTASRFLPSMTMWDACQEALPPLGPREPLVIALDAGVSNDSFGMVGVTRHPLRRSDVAPRFIQEWRPPAKGTLDFRGTEDLPGPEMVLRRLCANYNVVQVPYDPYQLVDMANRMSGEGVAWFRPFSQGADRLEADKQLLDLITQRRLAHDGNAALRTHIDNADRKPDPETRKLRIVKREGALKVDLAVALSMACAECLRLDL